MPGKARELLTWFGKSERPVPTTRAPAFVATSGQISGTGLAQANTTGSLAIAAIHSGRIVSGPGSENARQTSEWASASAMPPVAPRALVV